MKLVDALRRPGNGARLSALLCEDVHRNSVAADQLMLKWLAERFSPVTSGPEALASARGVRTLIGQLEHESPERVIRAVAELCEAIPRQPNTTPNACRGLEQLDEFAQRFLAQLWEALLTDGRGQTVVESTWGALSRYYRAVHAGYWHYLSGINAAVKLSERDHASAMTNAARAMTALAKYMLLLRMRYRSAPQDVWALLNNLVAWVAKRGNASVVVQEYPGSALSTTIEREMLTALLIEVAPTANLLPAQMHALDHLLRLHAAFYRISDMYDEQGRPFAYESARNEAPRRWLMGLPTRTGVRFFGVSGGYAQLCSERDRAKTSRVLPDWLGVTKCTMDDYQDLLDRLVAVWSLKPPQRRQRREPCAGEVLVAHDWADIRRLVKFSELARSGRSLAYDNTILGINNTIRAHGDSTMRDPNTVSQTISQEMLTNLVSFEKSLDQDATEPWLLTDSSEEGLGAAAVTDCPWVKVGMMIAVRRPESVEWQLALVRRLNKLANNRLSIGMAKLPGILASARLRLGVGSIDYTRAIARNDSSVEYDALMLQDKICTLLLPVGVVDTTWKYTLTANNRQETIKMERLIQRGLNFEHVEMALVEAMRAA